MKIIFLVLTISIAAIYCTAQKQPLIGSGKLITKNYDFANFTKIALLDLSGKATITVGNTFAITISIDDNLANLLDAQVGNNELTIRLKNNYQNRLYLEDNNITINITLPAVTKVVHRGNGKVYINNIIGESFTIKNIGNGNAYLQGNTNELTIICRDNGSVYATNMSYEKQHIRRSGNGSVYANSNNSTVEENSGNGTVVTDKTKKQDTTNLLVNTTIINNTKKDLNYTIKYPVRGSYGISVAAGQVLKESFPIGTKIYKGNQFTLFKKAEYTVTSNATQEFIIN